MSSLPWSRKVWKTLNVKYEIEKSTVVKSNTIITRKENKKRKHAKISRWVIFCKSRTGFLPTV